MTDVSQGAAIERLNLTLTSAPFVTTLQTKQFVATINGRDSDGEDRVARFNAPKGSDQDGVQKILDDAYSKGSIDLEGTWVTRRYKIDNVTRSAVEFAVSSLTPGPEKTPAEIAAETAPKREPGKTVAVLASHEEVSAALEQMKTGNVSRASPMVEALVMHREALEQQIYEPVGNGRFKGTGRYALGADALEGLAADFGNYAHRNVYINEAKAASVAERIAPDHAEKMAETLAKALEQTQLRRAAQRDAVRTAPAQEAKPAEPAPAKPAAEKAPEAKPAKGAPVREAAPSPDPGRAAAIAHQADPMLLTASLAELKAAVASRGSLNSPVADTLRTFVSAVKQPEWRKRADGKGNEKTGAFGEGAAGINDLIKNFGAQGYRNVYIDKSRATDVLMAVDDPSKVNASMAAALDKSRERRIQMQAAKAAGKPKVKARERDRD